VEDVMLFNDSLVVYYDNKQGKFNNNSELMTFKVSEEAIPKGLEKFHFVVVASMITY
jgi:hypothetical protein